jgi:hypothetical protein
MWVSFTQTKDPVVQHPAAVICKHAGQSSPAQTKLSPCGKSCKPRAGVQQLCPKQVAFLTQLPLCCTPALAAAAAAVAAVAAAELPHHLYDRSWSAAAAAAAQCARCCQFVL